MRQKSQERLQEVFESLADRLGLKKCEIKPEVGEATCSENDSGTKETPKTTPGRPRKKATEKVSDSSGDSSDSSEEEEKPASPGTWEIVPGSSQTRPQFIKIRPGQTLETALEARSNALGQLGGMTSEPTKRRRRRSSTKESKPVGKNSNKQPKASIGRGRGRPPKTFAEPKMSARPVAKARPGAKVAKASLVHIRTDSSSDSDMEGLNIYQNKNICPSPFTPHSV